MRPPTPVCCARCPGRRLGNVVSQLSLVAQILRQEHCLLCGREGPRLLHFAAKMLPHSHRGAPTRMLTVQEDTYLGATLVAGGGMQCG